jgi:hypothetical protein
VFLKEEDAKTELGLLKELLEKMLCSFSSKNMKDLFLIENFSINQANFNFIWV